MRLPEESEMMRKVVITLFLFFTLLALIWAGSNLCLVVTRNKIDIVQKNDDKNPYLYSESLKGIQKKLNKVLSFNLTNYNPIDESGFWNNETEKALNTFQDMYYKKYHLQRYYAFSAGQDADPTAIEGILDNEVPNPANFQKESQEGIKLKLGDPAKYYGNSCQDELHRIEKGFYGDFVDPVTGELSKNILIYRTPVGNDHLIPIQLSARYGSQYSGNVGMGPGWFLTENYSFWYSFEKNEVIIQDGSGVSQKFQYIGQSEADSAATMAAFMHLFGGPPRMYDYYKMIANSSNQFIRKGDTTDGGYFSDIRIFGAFGTQDSVIVVVTSAGDILKFGGFLNSGENSVNEVITNIASSTNNIYGYTICPDLAKHTVTNYSPNEVWESTTSILTNQGGPYTNVTYGFKQEGYITNIFETNNGTNITKGLFGDAAASLVNTAFLTNSINRNTLLINTNDFISDIRKWLSDNTTFGWSVSYYTADGKIHSFRRSTPGTPDIYAGYALQTNYNRFGAYKTYDYNSFQKLITVKTFSPGGTQVDEVDFQRNEEQNESDSERNLINSIAIDKSNRADLTFTGENRNLERLNLTIDGSSLKYTFNYSNVLACDPNSSNLVAMTNTMISNKNELLKGISNININISNINKYKSELSGQSTNLKLNLSDISNAVYGFLATNNTPAGYPYALSIYNQVRQYYLKFEYDKGILSWDQYNSNLINNQTNQINTLAEYQQMTNSIINWLTILQSANYQYSKTYNYSEDYYNLQVEYLNQQIQDMQNSLKEIDLQIMDYNAGRMFSWIALLNSSSEFDGNVYRNSSYTYFDYTNTNTNEFNVTNIESRYRAVSVHTPYWVGTFDYTPGNTFFTNLNGNGFKFRYDNTLTNYDDRRVTYIRYPNLSEVSISYDEKGNMTYFTNELTNAYSYIYDEFGNVTNKTVPGLRWKYEYSDTTAKYLGRPTKIVQPDKTEFHMSYDTNGELTSQGFYRSGGKLLYNLATIIFNYQEGGGYTKTSTDMYGCQTTYVCDKDHNLAKIINPDNGVYLYQNDIYGKVLTENRADLVTNFYQYDARGNVISQGIQGCSTNRAAYDAWGEKTAVTDPNGNTTRFYYDYCGRLSKVSFPNNNEVNYWYDTNGNKTQESYDKDGKKKIVYKYDVNDRQTEKDLDQENHSYAYSYSYDVAGNLTNQKMTGRGFNSPAVIISSNVADISYAYNGIGLLTNQTDTNSGKSVSYVYDLMGRMTSETAILSNESYVKVYTYDGLGRNTSLSVGYGSGNITASTLFSSNTYFTNHGMEKIDRYTNRSTNYSDFRNNVTNLIYSVFNPASNGMVIYSHSYNYDNLGNKINEIYPDGTKQDWEYKYGNRLYRESARYRIPGGSPAYKTYSYDLAGHITNMKDFETNNWIKTYNSMGFVSGETDPAGRSASYEYDIFGNPMVVRQGSRTKNVEYNLLNKPISEINDDGANQTTNLVYYDALGNPGLIAPGGNGSFITLKAFDAEGRQILEIDPNGLKTVLTYNAMGGLETKTIIDTNTGISRSWTYQYDECGRITNEEQPDNTSISYGYTLTYNNVPVKTKSWGSRVEMYYYDQMDRVIKTVITDPTILNNTGYNYYHSRGIISGTIFNTAGLPEEEIQPDGGTNLYAYSAEGKVTSETNPLMQVKTTAYDKNGLMTNMTDFDGNKYNYVYDGSGKIIQEINPDNGTTAYNYDAFGNIARKVLPENETYSYEYSLKNRVARETNPLSGVTAYGYNALGQVTNINAPGGNLTAFYYNNGVLQEIHRSGNDSGHDFITTFNVDAFGETNLVNNPDNGATIFGYDNLGRMIWKAAGPFVTSAGSAQAPLVTNGLTVYNYSYTAEGYLSSVIYPNGMVETNLYSQGGLLTNKYFITNTTKCRETFYKYTDDSGAYYNGKPAVTWNFKGITNSFKYDALGRVTNASESAGIGSSRAVNYNYSIITYSSENFTQITTWKTVNGNGAGQAEWTQEVRDFRGNTVEVWKNLNAGNPVKVINNSYNKSGKITDEKRYFTPDPDISGETTNSYNSGGMLQQKIDPSGLTTTFSYDNAGRVLQKNEGGRITGYQYYNNGNLMRIITGNSLRDEKYEYDFRGNVTNKINNLSHTSNLTYFDIYGNKTAECIIYNGTVSGRNWVYDQMGRVVSATNELGGTVVYRYDMLGEKTNEIAAPSALNGGAGLALTNNYVYDAMGNLTGKSESGSTLSNGQLAAVQYATSNMYDCWGNITNTIYPDSSRESSAYDTWGRKISETDRFGYTTSYLYDYYGRETGRTEETPFGALNISNTYDFAGRITFESRNDGSTKYINSTNIYDNSGNIIRQILFNRNVNNIEKYFGYDVYGNKTSEIDYNGNTAYTYYDDLNRPVRQIDREGNLVNISYTYAADGSYIVTTSQNDMNYQAAISSSITYDGFGNKIQITDANHNTENYIYNLMGKVLTATDKNGFTNYFRYDSLGRLTASIDPYGGTNSNIYDSFGNAVTTVDKENNQLAREFDWAGRMVRSTDAMTNRASFQYSIAPLDTILLTQNHSGSGLKCEVEVFTDAESNQTTTYRYGKQTIAVKDALNNTTSYNYDTFGNMTAAIDAKGNRTTLEYDIRGNKVKETTALGFTTEYQYDNNGNIILEKNGEGSISTSYNRNNQPVSKTYSDNNVKHFQYDGLGRLTWAGDNFSAYRYKYDSAGNLTNRYDEKNGETLAYEYDGNGNRTRMVTIPSIQFSAGAENHSGTGGKTVVYKYDGLNQISLETAVSTNTTNLQISYSYSSMGRITNKQYSTGLTVNYGYDNIYRLTSISNTTNASSALRQAQYTSSAQVQFLSSYGYTYDKVGNRTKETVSEAGAQLCVSTFQYDKTYRLVSANYGLSNSEVFSYDACGNRLVKTTSFYSTPTNQIATPSACNNITHYTYDNDNRLMLEQSTKGSVSYTYDRAGRLVKKDGSGKTERFKYDSRDLMTEYNLLENGNTTITKNVYDVNNLRISKNETSDAAGSIDQPAIRFVYDGQNILFDDSTFYLNNIMINSYEAEISVKTSVYLKDAQGSVRGELYDSPITINTHSFSYQTYDYTAFGEQIASNPGPLSKSGEGETNSSSSSVKEGISYTGHYFDSESKLYYARARFLDPSTGRFITQDPIQDPDKRYGPAGLNWYVYGLNNPMTFWDPYGEDIISSLFMGASMGQVSSTALGDDVMSNAVGAMFEAKDSSYQGVSLDCYNYVNEQVNPNYEEFIGIDLGFVKYGYGKSKNEGYYIEEGSSLEVNLAPIGAPVYFGGGVDFKHSYTYRTETFNWNVNAGIGIGDPKYLQVGAGLSFGGTMERSLNGDEYDRMWKSQSEYIGTNAGITSNGANIGLHAQWNYGEYGEYEGMNYGFGLSYGYNQQTGYNQGFDIGAGMDWYYDKNGNYRGRTENANIGYGFTDYAGLQASATSGYLDGQRVGSLNSNFYFDPAKIIMNKLGDDVNLERELEYYKNLMDAMEYNLSNPVPATPEVAAEFNNQTPISPPSSVAGNTPSIEATSLHTGNYANDYGANINPITGSVNYANDYNAPINPNYTDNPTNYRDTSWHGQESLNKVNDAFQEFKNQYKNGKIPFNSLTYDSIKDFADDHNMTDAERLYFTERIAYDNPAFNPTTTSKLVWVGIFPSIETKTQTYCDRYASYVTKLYTGNSDLETVGHWGVPYATKYFTDNSYGTMDANQGYDVQEMANHGQLVYVANDNHMALLAPGKGVYVTYQEEDYYAPAIAQQGRDNILNNLTPNGTLNYGFRTSVIPDLTYYFSK